MNYKEHKLKVISDKLLQKRISILPDYKLINASLGIYSDAEVKEIHDTIQKYRNKYYELKALIDATDDKFTIINIVKSIDNLEI